MKYDPIKDFFNKYISRKILARKIFYKVLDFLFLRTWHVKKELRSLYKKNVEITIYDAGMGFGQYTYYLSNRYQKSNILAVDIKEDQINDCHYFFEKIKKNNVLFKIEDLTKISHNNRFDLILSVDVMEHILEDELVFKNLSNSLKKGGVLLINTPSNLGGSDVNSEGEKSFIEEHARNGYSKNEIIEKLEKNGLRILKFKYTYGKMGSLSWKLSIKFPIKLLNISRLFIIILPIYYCLTIWLTTIFNFLDVYFANNKGSGIVVLAKK